MIVDCVVLLLEVVNIYKTLLAKSTGTRSWTLLNHIQSLECMILSGKVGRIEKGTPGMAKNG